MDVKSWFRKTGAWGDMIERWSFSSFLSALSALVLSYCLQFLLPNKSKFRNPLSFIWTLDFLPLPLSPLTVSKRGNLCFVLSLFLSVPAGGCGLWASCLLVSVLPGSHRMQCCCFLTWLLSYQQSSVNCSGCVKNLKFCVYLMFSVCQIDLGEFRQRIGRFLALCECERFVSLD